MKRRPSMRSCSGDAFGRSGNGGAFRKYSNVAVVIVAAPLMKYDTGSPIAAINTPPTDGAMTLDSCITLCWRAIALRRWWRGTSPVMMAVRLGLLADATDALMNVTR